MQYFYISDSNDALNNLARDEYLLSAIKPGEIVLYLYINKNAVIIGRNQNPYCECNLSQMDMDGVQLVRRISGGGAVYHDRGNLNYSFIAHRDIYDEKRQTGVIVKALESFGIKCAVSGRNDMTVDGHKFSGNAFSGRGENRQHHGTLLINSDLSIFDRYLIPSKLKLEAKGVKSVRARVCNLSEFNETVTVDSMADALRNAFETEYGASTEYKAFNESKIAELKKKHGSYEWRMGETPHFDYTKEARFSWGTARLCLEVENGIIKNSKLYTDSLDADISGKAEKLFTGKAFRKEVLSEIQNNEDGALADLSAMIIKEIR